MKQFICLICCGLVIFLLTGFDSGIEAEKIKDAQVKPTGRVLKYEEPVVLQESNQDLYHEYHLLVITLLEESSDSLSEDPDWSYHMANNAYNYIKLIIKLVKEEHQDIFINKIKDIKALIIDLSKRNIPNSKKQKLSIALNALAEDLEKNFNFEKIQLWIKD